MFQLILFSVLRVGQTTTFCGSRQNTTTLRKSTWKATPSGILTSVCSTRKYCIVKRKAPTYSPCFTCTKNGIEEKYIKMLLVRKHEGNRRRRIWDDNIKICLKDGVWGYKLVSSGSGQGPVADSVNTIINFWFHKMPGILWVDKQLLAYPGVTSP
jgi:hypothetical protein